MKYLLPNHCSILFGVCLFAAPLFMQLQATEVHVSSMSALQSAINSASAADTIVLANGTYTNSSLTIGTSNITVRPETPGGVYLNGTQNIDITGHHIIFSGFQFLSGNIDSAYLIEVSGSHNILTHLNFNGYSAKKYIHIQGGTQYNEISYCNIENKPTTAVIGCTIQITTTPTVPGYHRIRYCSFKNFPGPGGDFGNEPIRIGLSTEMTNNSRTIVEYCYFNNVGLGDSESISVKSSENICRYNTFTNNAKGMLVLRHGYRNIVYGNFFINGSGGVRIKEGGDHFVYNNYFETGSADALTLQYVAEYPLTNINLVHNTFVNHGKIDLGGTGPSGVLFANNIFKKSSGSIFSNANGQTSFAGNIFLGTAGITIPPGMTNADPLLVTNSDGYFGLSSSSPAIDASSPMYPAILDIQNCDDDPAVMLDISGQPRPAISSLKDVGCDEFTDGVIINRPLTLKDVGPEYLRDPATGAAMDPLKSARRTEQSGSMVFECYPNPFNPMTTISFHIPASGYVSLKIFDQLGREAATLVDGIRPTGQHQVQWNASQYSGGFYFCRLQTERHRETKKILYLK